MKRYKRPAILVFSALLGVLAAVWIIQIVNGRVPLVDQWTRGPVEWFGESFLYGPFRGLTELGSRSFLIPFVVTAAVLLGIYLRNWLPPLFLIGGTYSTHLLNDFIKGLVLRERPSISVSANAVGYSFPSGHAMIPVVCYGLLAYFIVKRMKSEKRILAVYIFSVLLVLLIGFSRYVINVHYLTDIIAGFAMGALCLFFLIFLYEQIEKYRSRS